MATETESNKQTLFFVVLGQKFTTHKVWAKSETVRGGPLFRYFGVYMELLLKVLVVAFEQMDYLGGGGWRGEVYIQNKGRHKV